MRKSGEIQSAAGAARELGAQLERAEKYQLAGMQRSILVYKKIKSTLSQYPRGPGIPERKPL
jgi:16S rRNA (guanine527-N7)-methyltransferase